MARGRVGSICSAVATCVMALPGSTQAAVPAAAPAYDISGCRPVGARPDPADANAMIVPVPVMYFGKKPSKTNTFKRKAPLKIGQWGVSYCDLDDDLLTIVYDPVPGSPPLYANCRAQLMLTAGNGRIGEMIDGTEAD